MRVATTGPSRLTDNERAYVQEAVRALVSPTEVTTGGAAGWDTAFALAALQAFPEAVHRLVLPGASYSLPGFDAVCALAVKQGTPLVIERLAPAANVLLSYRRRNERLVEHADVLVAASFGESFYRSGEWMTINIARRALVPVRLIDLWEVTPA